VEKDTKDYQAYIDANEEPTLEAIFAEVHTLQTGAIQRTQLAKVQREKADALDEMASEMLTQADELLTLAENINNRDISATQENLGGIARGENE